MKRLWKWLAAAGGAVVAVLVGVVGVLQWRREKERRDHGYDLAAQRQEKAQAEADAQLGRVLADTKAADERAEAAAAKAVEQELKSGGGLADFVNARTRPRVRERDPGA